MRRNVPMAGGEAENFEGGLSVFRRFNATRIGGKYLSMGDMDIK